MKHAILTNSKGQRPHLGSDGILPLDGRWSNRTIGLKVAQFKARYKANFRDKHDAYTHYGVVSSLKYDPTTWMPIPMSETN